MTRSRVKLDQLDAGRSDFADGIEAARLSGYHLIEMLVSGAQLNSNVCGGSDRSDRDAQLALVGRAVARMTGDRSELSNLLGSGVDAAAAEAVFAAPTHPL